MQTLESISCTRLKGVGPQLSKRLEKLGIHSIVDLIFHMPFRYEDRSRIVPINSVAAGHKIQVEGRIEAAEIQMRPRRTLICRIADQTGVLTLRFFYFGAAQSRLLAEGASLRCFGEIRSGFNGPEMIHPEFRLLQSGNEAIEKENSLTPVYRLTEGIRQPLMRRIVSQAIGLWKNADDAGGLVDWVPQDILQSMQFPPLNSAIELLHAPPLDVDQEQLATWCHPAQQRLVFEELIAHYLCLARAKQSSCRKKAHQFEKLPALVDRFIETLPFQLTRAQRRVIGEVDTDLASARPMMRLIHGDVGSGKTVIAACCSLAVLQQKWQVAVMVPTELLAEQHFDVFKQWLEPLGFQVGLLSGNQTEKSRRMTLEAIRSGQIGMLIGTHALFQQSVEFHRLGLVVIDEQHRFGVHQRLALRDKGLVDAQYPHQLVMSATPIPRTLAMLRFADLDISVIDELPAGRSPVRTSIIPSSRRDDVVQRIASWVAKDRQAYWLCTLVEESEVLQCEAAEKTTAMLVKALPDVRVAMVHGRMSSAEKDCVMQEFKRHQIDLLVATTVIEVGLDVPNADLMVIENPERLGLAQLHQLRGRVGRGGNDSYCLLMYQPPLSKLAGRRLSILRETSDGFKIAEQDLELRGPGDVMGTRQTGQIQFKLADLARDRMLLQKAVSAAQRIEQENPEKTEPLIRRWIGDARQYSDV